VSESFGSVLRGLREREGLSLRAIAKSAHCSHGHIADLEAGRRRSGAALAKLLDTLLGAEGELLRLAPESDDLPTFRVRSHKFVAGYIGGMADHLIASREMQPVAGLLPNHWVTPVPHSTGDAKLNIWQHGATIFHILEEAEWSDITSLALWRYASYERDLKWAAAELPLVPKQPYVFSVYWIDQAAWAGEKLQTALRLMCSPRILVGTDVCLVPASGDVESTLLRDGFPLQDGVVEFGTGDTASGYASWSSVVYKPFDCSRALQEADLVTMELAVQATWQYCSWISQQIEAGMDPQVPENAGWRWIRGIRSRLVTARPQETGPHRAMREAILATSGLPEMLESAIITLRELD
jgi:transcriptional regulator with XRE-family HTH domain